MSDIDQTIIDSTKPNAGRVYDYFLGGHHNFETDRKMGDEILKQAPFGATLAKIIRLFLREGIKRSVQQGFTQFLDLASGLPTDDHIHNTTPEGTKIIYSDIDPITVQYGKKLIGNNQIVKYAMLVHLKFY